MYTWWRCKMKEQKMIITMNKLLIWNVVNKNIKYDILLEKKKMKLD